MIKFFVTYYALVFVYNAYLQQTQKKEYVFQCAPLTNGVANQSVAVLNIFGYNVVGVQHKEEMSIKLIIDDVYIGKVIEGCNSMSIIILFVSFIVAFTGTFKATFFFGLLGSLFIYTINILRIAFLTVMLYKFPNQQDFLHNLLFPAIIYGTTFLLWVVWVNKFSNYKK